MTDADICYDPDWQDHHPWRKTLRHSERGQGQDPGKAGRHADRNSKTDVRWETYGRQRKSKTLQRPKPVHSLPPNACAGWGGGWLPSRTQQDMIMVVKELDAEIYLLHWGCLQAYGDCRCSLIILLKFCQYSREPKSNGRVYTDLPPQTAHYNWQFLSELLTHSLFNKTDNTSSRWHCWQGNDCHRLSGKKKKK